MFCKPICRHSGGTNQLQCPIKELAMSVGVPGRQQQSAVVDVPRGGALRRPLGISSPRLRVWAGYMSRGVPVIDGAGRCPLVS